jgi:hypothetical protein
MLITVTLVFLVFTSYVGIESIQYAKDIRTKEIRKGNKDGIPDIPINSTPIMTKK